MIGVPSLDPRHRLRAAATALAGIVSRAGVGTIEVPARLAEKFLADIPTILELLKEAEEDRDTWENDYYTKVSEVKELKKTLKSFKGVVTRLKGTVKELRESVEEKE